MIPRNLPHQYGASDARPWSIHWVHFIGEDSEYYVRLLPDGVYELPVSDACVSAMETTFRHAYAALAGASLGRNVLYLAHVLRHLLGDLFYGNDAYSPELRLRPGRDPQATIHFMTEHMAGPIRLADMARHAGLSPVHFASLPR